ncbi:hypothetical protein VNO77_24558 [Canavalia gladiata]|uniref:Uncharacterized protein n=1 Tax=Canavalia gladiata TaxID=3824 RepID=A0AAN9QCM9_CANGL
MNNGGGDHIKKKGDTTNKRFDDDMEDGDFEIDDINNKQKSYITVEWSTKKVSELFDIGNLTIKFESKDSDESQKVLLSEGGKGNQTHCILHRLFALDQLQEERA